MSVLGLLLPSDWECARSPEQPPAAAYPACQAASLTPALLSTLRVWPPHASLALPGRASPRHIISPTALPEPS